MHKDWQAEYQHKLVTAEQAVSVVKSGDLVVIPLRGEPPLLCQALLCRAGDLQDVRVLQNGAITNFGWHEPPFRDAFHLGVEITFWGDWIREAVRHNEADFYPCLFTTRASTLERDTERVDVCMLAVSPPDENGLCSFGQSVWNKRSYARRAKVVLAEVNANFIRTCGDNSISVSEIDYFVENTVPIPEPVPMSDPDDVTRQIAENVSSLIKDGDTIEVGFGSLPYTFARLGVFDDRVDLGWHSELTPPGIVTLVREGVFNGKRKTLHPGKAVASQTSADLEEQAFVHNNPVFELYDVEYTNHPGTISAHDNFVAINGAISVDLTGQINLEVLPGNYPQNGGGGQLEFAFGALLSRGGRSIHALRSLDRKGRNSRIVARFEDDPVVSIPRTLADFVVTEYGIASLQGKSLRERAEACIAIAHPDFRDDLRKYLLNRFYSTPGTAAPKTA